MKHKNYIILVQHLIHLYQTGQKKNLARFRQILKQNRKQQAQLNEHHQVLKEIAWVNSHQLRGPVASILGLFSLIKQTDDPVEKGKYYPMINKCIEELDGIVHHTADKLNVIIKDKLIE